MKRSYCITCWRPIETDEQGVWSHVLPVPLRDPTATGAMLGLFTLAVMGHDAAPHPQLQRLVPA